MRLVFLLGLGALMLVGCAAQGPHQLTLAEVKHAVEVCGAPPSGPFTPAQRRCLRMQKDVIDARPDCIKNAAPDQVDRCAIEEAKYTDAWRQCGGIAGGDKAVYCAIAKEPEGHHWMMTHKG